MPSRSQAERTAERYAVEYVKRLKKDVEARKLKDRAAILAKRAYTTAEYVGRLALAGKAQKILNRVAAAMRDGRLDANDLDRKKLKEIAGEALKEQKANLLMRNFLSTAYNAGYLEQGLKDRTKAYWLYKTAGDSRVRPTHAKFNNVLFEKGDPLALRIFPPNGHNCRCRMKAVSRKQAEGLMAAGQATDKMPRLKSVTYIDKATGKRIRTLEGVDPGWDGPPSDRTGDATKLLERQLQLLEKTEGV
jgi:SPP1 gp7 family putative phage head morphogenesis protein